MAAAEPSPMGAHMARVRGKATTQSFITCSTVRGKVYWARGFRVELLWFLAAMTANCALGQSVFFHVPSGAGGVKKSIKTEWDFSGGGRFSPRSWPVFQPVPFFSGLPPSVVDKGPGFFHVRSANKSVQVRSPRDFSGGSGEAVENTFFPSL